MTAVLKEETDNIKQLLEACLLAFARAICLKLLGHIAPPDLEELYMLPFW